MFWFNGKAAVWTSAILFLVKKIIFNKVMMSWSNQSIYISNYLWSIDLGSKRWWFIILVLRLATPFADNDTDPATTFKEFRARPNTQVPDIFKYYV
jgi:hypothetical protein